MAITAVALTQGGSDWAVNATSADASGTEELKAAPSAGALYLKKIIISCVDAITVTIGAGETTGAVTTVLVGPVNFAATSGSPFVCEFTNPIKLPDTTALVIDATDAGAVNVIAEGFTR